jgi:nitrous oxidase accessory protein NosD
MRRWVSLSGIASLVLAVMLGFGVTPALAATTIVVHPGQSIQAAVDLAHPGDTILIMPGRYRQSVLVATDNLRIRGSGAGRGGTVLEPAATPSGVCATDFKSGICVLDPLGQETVDGVHVDGLLVRNFEGDGVIGVGTTGLVIQNVAAWNNARYGVTKFASSGGAFINNVATGSADAGIYVGDSPAADVLVTGNDVWNNGFGILVRNAQGASIKFNDVHDNCIGIFVWWLPGVAGDSTIRHNTSRHNNKFCSGEGEVGFDYSGSGIALMGAHGVVVADNLVLNNRGSTPVSGGIVVVSGALGGGPPSTGNTIRGNSAFGDKPADIIDTSGGVNIFHGNFCSLSIPGGLC